METVPQEVLDSLRKPLPNEAIKPHPTRGYLSAINPAYVIERLNEVFGVNGWDLEPEIIENGQMIVVKGKLVVPQYGIIKTAFGGNDNTDRGDAYKGACTDALTKAASSLGIGLDIYRGLHDAPKPPSPERKAAPSPHAPNTSPVRTTVHPSEPGTFDGRVVDGKLYCKPLQVTDPVVGQYGPSVEIHYYKLMGKNREVRDYCSLPGLFAALKGCEGKQCVFLVQEKPKYNKIVGIAEVAGQKYEKNLPVIQVNSDITDEDIPF